MTLHARVAAARERLRAAGITERHADLDARLLARYVLGWDAGRLLTDGSLPEPADFQAAYEPLLARRIAREPIAYITGRQEFWGLTFEVSPAVLIPRPETELLVETLLELSRPPERPLSVADACTGSGCVAVALAVERPSLRVVATDVSDDALAVARRNAISHRVADRIEFVRTNLLDGLPSTFDAVVANPPYVPDNVRCALAPEVRDHEPGIALFSADEGLSVIKRLVAESIHHLAPGGLLVCECGYGQADAVRELISNAHALTMVDFKSDLQGIERALVARKTA